MLNDFLTDLEMEFDVTVSDCGFGELASIADAIRLVERLLPPPEPAPIITVTLSASTSRWLHALARANKVAPKELLEQASYCMADAAGRREGSWEADVAREMLSASGYQAEVGWDELPRLLSLEEKEAV